MIMPITMAQVVEMYGTEQLLWVALILMVMDYMISDIEQLH
jgi:hypothetical protein